MSISIQFLGAVGTVTGSQFLVTVGERRVLVDCGMFQGSPEEVSRNRIPFAFEADGLDALLLTHAHLDHCGRIPALVKSGFRGPIHATLATLDLAEIVLLDSAKLQMEAAERYQRKHPEEVAAAASAGSEEAAAEETDTDVPKRLREAKPEGRTTTREALYTIEDVEQTMRQFRGLRYDDEVQITDGVTAIFHDAGHILGSAIIELRLTNGDRSTTVVFSGDLGRDSTPILRDPTRLSHADYVLVESTYGDREHAPQEEAVEALVTAIGEVANDEGVLLVPAFAIGRTQEVIWMLDHLVREGRIPRLPLYLDSPMASRATKVYLDHPETYDEETSKLLNSGDSPLEYPGQEFTDSVEQSKAIRTHPRPMMVVAASGMLTGGRIMHHLKDFLPDPKCTLLFIGYQGEGTLGRHLQNGGKTARIDHQEWDVRCRVKTISGFSAHADENELARWLGAFGSESGKNAKPRRVFVVHGDPDAAQAFGKRIRDELHMDPHLPEWKEQVALD
ncbi:MAG: MBL fold metallo-hydrolase [Chloroflexota bacterium]